MDAASANSNVSPVRWSLRLFDGFELGTRPEGERVPLPGKRDRALLAYLALSPDHRQSRRKLTTLLWGDVSDETTLDNLRVCIWSLRKALGDSEHRLIASDGDDIVLDIAAFDVDVLMFRRLASGSQRPELEAAAALYADEFLGGLSIDSKEFESWRRAQAAHLRDDAIVVSTRWMAQCAEAGEIERAIDIGQRILNLEPLHEPTTRSMMRLQV